MILSLCSSHIQCYSHFLMHYYHMGGILHFTDIYLLHVMLKMRNSVFCLKSAGLIYDLL